MTRIITIGIALLMYGIGLMHYGSPLDLLLSLLNRVYFGVGGCARNIFPHQPPCWWLGGCAGGLFQRVSSVYLGCQPRMRRVFSLLNL